MLLLCLFYLKVSNSKLSSKAIIFLLQATKGTKESLERLRQHAYWVNMAKDVLSYCRSCEKCQQAKLALPQCASLDQIVLCTVDQVLFSTLGLPGILLSDQGRNFESTIFKQILEAFGVTKVRKTAYHPQGNGMVE